MRFGMLLTISFLGAACSDTIFINSDAGSCRNSRQFKFRSQSPHSSVFLIDAANASSYNGSGADASEAPPPKPKD